MEYLNTKSTLLGIKSFLCVITCVWYNLDDMDFRSIVNGAGGITASIQVIINSAIQYPGQLVILLGTIANSLTFQFHDVPTERQGMRMCVCVCMYVVHMSACVH